MDNSLEESKEAKVPRVASPQSPSRPFHRSRTSPYLHDAKSDHTLNTIQRQLSHSILPKPPSDDSEYEMMDSLVELRDALANDDIDMRIAKVMTLDAAIGPNRIHTVRSPKRNQSVANQTTPRHVRSKVIHMGDSPLIMTSMSVFPTYTIIPSPSGTKPLFERPIEKDFAFLDTLPSSSDESASDSDLVVVHGHNRAVHSFLNSGNSSTSFHNTPVSEQGTTTGISEADASSPGQVSSPTSSILSAVNSLSAMDAHSPVHPIPTSSTSPKATTSNATSPVLDTKPPRVHQSGSTSVHSSDHDTGIAVQKQGLGNSDSESLDVSNKVDPIVQMDGGTPTDTATTTRPRGPSLNVPQQDIRHHNPVPRSDPSLKEGLLPPFPTTSPVVTPKDTPSSVSNDDITGSLHSGPNVAKAVLLTECPFPEDNFFEHASDTLVSQQPTDAARDCVVVHDTSFQVAGTMADGAHGVGIHPRKDTQCKSKQESSTANGKDDDIFAVTRPLKRPSVVRNLSKCLDLVADDPSISSELSSPLSTSLPGSHAGITDKSGRVTEYTPREPVVLPTGDTGQQVSYSSHRLSTTSPLRHVSTSPIPPLSTGLQHTPASPHSPSSSKSQPTTRSTAQDSPNTQNNSGAQDEKISDSVIKGLVLLGRVEQQLRKSPSSVRSTNSNVSPRVDSTNTRLKRAQSLVGFSVLSNVQISPPSIPSTASSASPGGMGVTMLSASSKSAPTSARSPAIMHTPSPGRTKKVSSVARVSSAQRQEEKIKRVQDTMVGVFKMFSESQSQPTTPSAQSDALSQSHEDVHVASPPVPKPSLVIETSPPNPKLRINAHVSANSPACTSAPTPSTPWSPVLRRIPKTPLRRMRIGTGVSPRVVSTPTTSTPMSTSTNTSGIATPSTSRNSDPVHTPMTPSSRPRSYRKPPVPRFSTPSSSSSSNTLHSPRGFTAAHSTPLSTRSTDRSVGHSTGQPMDRSRNVPSSAPTPANFRHSLRSPGVNARAVVTVEDPSPNSATDSPASMSKRVSRKPPVPRFRATPTTTPVGNAYSTSYTPSVSSTTNRKSLSTSKPTAGSLMFAAITQGTASSKETDVGTETSTVTSPVSDRPVLVIDLDCSAVPSSLRSARHQPMFWETDRSRPVFVYKDINDEYSAFTGNVLQRIRRMAESIDAKEGDELSASAGNKSPSSDDHGNDRGDRGGGNGGNNKRTRKKPSSRSSSGYTPRQRALRQAATPSNIPRATRTNPSTPRSARGVSGVSRTAKAPSLPFRTPSKGVSTQREQQLSKGPSSAPTPTRKPPVPVFRRQRTDTQNTASQPVSQPTTPQLGRRASNRGDASRLRNWRI